jgi:hypothetical protein
VARQIWWSRHAGASLGLSQQREGRNDPDK